MNSDVKSILLVGVGGEGVIRASDILSAVMMNAGYDVKKSEVHGMAQRGGCVSSHVRFGKKVYSPLSKKGDVDILVSFEKMETLRYLEYLKPEGKVIINNNEVLPPSVNLGEEEYPADAVDTVRSCFDDVRVVNASEIALEAGNVRMANTVILGTLSAYLDVDKSVWEEVLRASFPERLISGNIAAFELGSTA
ncbi:MAG: indolepyruvate oxidoreductase subunit beta [Syntrophobacterales bacterium]|nr:MAG: indolepyruvate oxidoreductase subunit beta [Syntrophobacterales bacterium]